MATAYAQDEPALAASFRRPGDVTDTYRIWADGIILRIEARGYWTARIAQSYADDVTRLIGEMRRIRPDLRVIADRSATPAVEAEAQEIMMTTYRELLLPGDRVAIVVNSSLAKAQIRLIAGREETQSFLSLSAAQAWLLAYG